MKSRHWPGKVYENQYIECRWRRFARRPSKYWKKKTGFLKFLYILLVKGVLGTLLTVLKVLEVQKSYKVGTLYNLVFPDYLPSETQNPERNGRESSDSTLLSYRALVSRTPREEGEMLKHPKRMIPCYPVKQRIQSYRNSNKITVEYQENRETYLYWVLRLSKLLKKSLKIKKMDEIAEIA